MPKYQVALPITGVIYVEVEADDEEDAIDAALDSDDISSERIEDWEVHRHIVQGNVCYATLWRAEATEISS